MNLRMAEEGKEYLVRELQTGDEELEAFLFSLGCFVGAPITVVSRKKSNLVVSVKDARYTIDNALAEVILI